MRPTSMSIRLRWLAVACRYPGLDKLEEKLPGVGSLLQGVLGGGGQQQPQQQQPSTQDGTATEPAPQQPSQQKQVNPENLLKDLLGF